MRGMTLILALFTVCLALFFLSVFLHVARLETRMNAQVTMLEKYMTKRYNFSGSPEPES